MAWSLLCYDHGERPNPPFTPETACRLYDLEHFEVCQLSCLHCFPACQPYLLLCMCRGAGSTTWSTLGYACSAQLLAGLPRCLCCTVRHALAAACACALCRQVGDVQHRTLRLRRSSSSCVRQVFWEKTLDTKAIVGWNSDTVRPGCLSPLLQAHLRLCIIGSCLLSNLRLSCWARYAGGDCLPRDRQPGKCKGRSAGKQQQQKCVWR